MTALGGGGGGGDEGGSLEETIPGVPGEDYPINAEVPDTGFSCDGRVSHPLRPWLWSLLRTRGLSLETARLFYYTWPGVYLCVFIHGIHRGFQEKHVVCVLKARKVSGFCGKPRGFFQDTSWFTGKLRGLCFKRTEYLNGFVENPVVLPVRSKVTKRRLLE